jgi:hypothetical protein
LPGRRGSGISLKYFRKTTASQNASHAAATPSSANRLRGQPKIQHTSSLSRSSFTRFPCWTPLTDWTPAGQEARLTGRATNHVARRDRTAVFRATCRTTRWMTTAELPETPATAGCRRRVPAGLGRGRPVPRWRKMRKGNRWRACEG